MNKKSKRSNVWYLLPNKALRDKNLNTTDKNILSVLIYLSQAFEDKDGYFFRERTKLIQDIEDSDFEISDRQITRCLSKLQHYGYIEYRAGFHNNRTNKGLASQFRITYNVDNQLEEQNNVTLNTNINTKPNLDNVSELDATYSVDIQSERQNNVTPNTNTNINTNINNTRIYNTGPKKEKNKKEKINIGIEKKEKNFFDVHRMQLEYLLENVDDELEVLEFLTDNPSIENYDLIRKKWSDNNTLIQELDRLWSNIKSK